jgi:HxlR-like helix-turn-helix
MPDVSQKVLIQQLREMQEHGLVHREIYRQVPPRVDYSPTALGLSLQPVLLALCAWGQRHAKELNELDQLADCVIKPVQPRVGKRSEKNNSVENSTDGRVFRTPGTCLFTNQYELRIVDLGALASLCELFRFHHKLRSSARYCTASER